MCGRIASVAAVGLDFDQANHQALTVVQSMNEAACDQFLCNDERVAGEKCLGQGLFEGHRPSIVQSVARDFENAVPDRLEGEAGLADDRYDAGGRTKARV